jgi:hypothetical protein
MLEVKSAEKDMEVRFQGKCVLDTYAVNYFVVVGLVNTNEIITDDNTDSASAHVDMIEGGVVVGVT